MTGPGDVDDVAVAVTDDAVQMGVDEIEARRGAPVPEQSGFDVPGCQRITQQRVVQQVDLEVIADRKIVGRAPVSIEEREFVGGES